MTARGLIGICSLVVGAAIGVIPVQVFATSNGYTVEDIKLSSAGELVDVCTVEASNVDHAAAMGFCYGFFEGAIRYHQAISGADVNRNLVCPPPQTTRLQAVDEFVSFMAENPQYQTEASIDAVFRALMARWPCEQAN